MLLPLVGGLGLLGNLASVLVLRSRDIDLKQTFCHILTMLAAFDTMFIICAIMAFALPLLSNYWADVSICTQFIG